MAAVVKQQYIEAVRRLTAQKMRLAYLRTADGEPKGKETEVDWQAEEQGEAAIRRLAKDLAEEEAEFWEWSAKELAEGLLIPLAYLCEVSGSDAFMRHCLLLALGYELNPHMAGDCAYLHNDGARSSLTPWLMGMTWHEEPELPDFYTVFLETPTSVQMLFQPDEAGLPLMEQTIRLKPRVRSFLLWELEEDRRLRGILTRWSPDEKLPPLGRQQPDIAALLSTENQVVELYGAEGTGRRFCVKTACAGLGRTAYLMKPAEMQDCGEPAESILDHILLECVLFQAVPVVLFPDNWTNEELSSWLKKLMHPLLTVSDLIFIISRRPLPGTIFDEDMERLILEVHDMSLLEKRAVWRQESRKYPFAEDVHVAEMANLFDFTYGKIREALRQAAANARTRGKPVIDREALRHGCYSFFEQNLVKKAVKVPAVYGWDDLVLPAFRKETLLTACNQVKYKHMVYETWGFERKMPYGRGVSMIFAGAPGTGKTMAAQVFAAELGLDLYKVELSAIVSKYVGETEKNLEEIFEQARQNRIILFFDEADALFARRTEVKDANDKYSNMEAAFLLQKIESYDGVTILATNLIQNFDEAFKRRVTFVIDFPFPAAAQRRELWQRALPPQMPVSELDLDYLAAGFELSGSSIRNIVLHAAFLAAAAGQAVGMREILPAVRHEFAKSGKILTRNDAGEYHMLLPEFGQPEL